MARDPGVLLRFNKPELQKRHLGLLIVWDLDLAKVALGFKPLTFPTLLLSSSFCRTLIKMPERGVVV